MTAEPAKNGLLRRFGLLEATALNMSNMVGVGPFITIPLIIASMNGPQCMIGWALGTILALADGMIWSELAAAMPGTGGTYHYFRQSFAGSRFARLMPFLFIWQFIFSGPLEIASGYIGFAQYVGYFWPSMGGGGTKLVALCAGVLVIALLYRRITAVAKLTVVLWAGMLVTVAWVITSGIARFDPKLAFDFPPDAFRFSLGFVLGLGGAMRIAMYDFLGYYDICYVGGEARDPVRVIPRAIFYSVIFVALIYSVMSLCIIGVVPWREAKESPFIAAIFMERIYGPWAGSAITLLILWTSLASVFALMLGYSRIPYAAAQDGFFFRVFGRLHPQGQFPYVSLLVIGGLSIAASLLDLGWVIDALIVARILIQFIGQIGAVTWLRRHRPDIERPFRMWLYPLPSLIALVGWTFLFVTADWRILLYGLGTLGAGLAAFAVWRTQVRRTA
ncbi:MAG: APC family permease [Bryobacteraceae bacterium]